MQRAVVPELVGEEQAGVAQAAALFQAANRLTIFLGPPLAGVLISLIGTANVLYVDAATYLASFLLVGAFVQLPNVTTDGPPTGVLDGVRFMVRDKLLRLWTPAFTVIDICWQLLFASLPVLVVTSYHANPRILGWLFGAFGGGALVGAFVSMPAVRKVEPLTLGASAFTLRDGVALDPGDPSSVGGRVHRNGTRRLLHVDRERTDPRADHAAYPA